MLFLVFSLLACGDNNSEETEEADNASCGIRSQPQFALSAFVSIAVACPKREARGTPKICPGNDKARLQ